MTPAKAGSKISRLSPSAEALDYTKNGSQTFVNFVPHPNLLQRKRA